MSKIIQLFKLNIDYSNRIFGLDLLRFFAIFFVLQDHAGRFVPKILLSYYNILRYDGVGIFFVLSGFLIGGILFKQLNKYKFDANFLIDFWIRRWMRTLPNYFLFLVMLLIFYKLINQEFIIVDKLSYFIFLQNIYSGELDFFGESWSLAVEEWFYISLPLLMFFFNFFLKSKGKSFLLSSIIVLAVCQCFRFQLFFNNSDYVNYNHTVLGRLDSIFWGVLAAYLFQNYVRYWNKYKYISLLLGIILLIQFKVDLLSVNISPLYKSTYTSLTIFLCLPYFNSLKTFSNRKVLKFVCYISLISYSIYLVNSQVSNFLSSGINWNIIVSIMRDELNLRNDLNIWPILLIINFMLFFVLTILISTLIYKYYEIPMTKLRDLPFFKNRLKKTLK